MCLSLSVISYREQPPAAPLSTKAENEEVSIGRSGDNSWVLPDPENDLSRHHAIIQHRDSGYYITDTSSNGVYILPSATPLGRQNTAELNNGDKLRMGDYVILVTIENTSSFDNTKPVADTPEKSSFDFFDSESDRPAVFEQTESDQPPLGDPFSQGDDSIDLPVPKAFRNTVDPDNTFDFFDSDTDKPGITHQTESDHVSDIDQAFMPQSRTLQTESLLLHPQ